MIYNKIQYIMSIKVVVVMEGLTALCGEWRRLSGDESPSWLLYTLGLVFIYLNVCVLRGVSNQRNIILFN